MVQLKYILPQSYEHKPEIGDGSSILIFQTSSSQSCALNNIIILLSKQKLNMDIYQLWTC